MAALQNFFLTFLSRSSPVLRMGMCRTATLQNIFSQDSNVKMQLRGANAESTEVDNQPVRQPEAAAVGQLPRHGRQQQRDQSSAAPEGMLPDEEMFLIALGIRRRG
jgi:hypothetical protein